MPELVVLPCEQMMQRQRLRGAVLPGAIGAKSALDDIAAALDVLQFGLEGGSFISVRMPQALIARGEVEDALSGRAVLCAGLLDDHLQDLAVTLRRNRQAMLEIPGGEAAFAGIKAKLDLAVFQR